MPIWAPPVPNRDVFPTELSHAATTISVRFRRNYFSDVNGQVRNPTLAVTTLA
jgi:receptor-type tyrosine-protein phosphatase beta